MSSVIEREIMFRNLAGNPTGRKLAQRALELEDQEEAKRQEQTDGYPWMGFEWFDIPLPTQTLNQFVVEGLLVTGGLRNTYRSRSSQTYKLKEPELVRECLQELSQIEQGEEEEEIPTDLFNFILGQDEVKDVFWKSLKSVEPVHILLIGPPASSKTMFLEDLSRLPLSRFTNGGGTSKAGLADYLLEFRPRYLIIDEIDKMKREDQSILLSLMQSGIVSRLKKRMRELEKMQTWVFAAANRDDNIWPELKSRFFRLYLKEYSQADFIQITRALLITREKVEMGVANHIAASLARYTRDVREAIHFGRLCKTIPDVDELLRLKWPGSKLM